MSAPQTLTESVAVTDDTFDREVLQAERPVLVDFWAPWCGPCHLIVPVLRQIAADEADRLAVRTMNVDKNPVTAARLAILGMPTLQLYVGGELVHQIVGARSRRAILAEIEPFLD